MEEKEKVWWRPNRWPPFLLTTQRTSVLVRNRLVHKATEQSWQTMTLQKIHWTLRWARTLKTRSRRFRSTMRLTKNSSPLTSQPTPWSSSTTPSKKWWSTPECRMSQRVKMKSSSEESCWIRRNISTRSTLSSLPLKMMLRWASTRARRKSLTSKLSSMHTSLRLAFSTSRSKK